MPKMVCAKRLLPDPLEPNTATISLSPISRDKSDITFRSCLLSPCTYCVKDIDKLFTSNNSPIIPPI